jgi:Kef-type K+ transport system membrane component KefB
MFDIFLLLAVIIFAAKAGGWVSTQLGQPAVLGELLIGLVLGPTALDLLHWPLFAKGHFDEVVKVLAEVGVILLMFIAGLEVEVEEMRRAGKVATWAGVLGVLVPWVLGTGVALLFNYPLQKSLFMGIILTATSVSISAQTLMELKVLRSREGIALLGAAVIDDVLVILVLSVFLALTSGPSADVSSLLWVIARMSLFLTGAVVLGVWLIRPLTRWIEQLPISQGLLALVVVVTLAFAWSAEALGGMAAITGAFLAGVFFGRTHAKHQIERGMNPLTYGFFVPIFFVSIGLEANARAIGWEGLPFVVLIILAAIVSKIIGCGVGARIGGYNWRESWRIGIGMVSRGEVGLIVASVGLTSGLISDAVFSAVVVMVLATTLVTPLLLRWAFQQQSANGGKS